MAKKLIKGSPLRKEGLLKGMISDRSESQKSDIPESHSARTEEKLKISFYLPPEDEELIEEIRRKWNKGRKKGKFSRSDVIHEALKLLAEKEGLLR